MEAQTETCNPQESDEERVDDFALVNWKQRSLSRLVLFSLDGNGLTQEQSVGKILLSDEG
jgi:hypothetical protein